MLQELESQNQKKCDTDLQGCDKPGTPLRKLENEPLMFTLLIAWEEQVSAEEVRSTLEAVDTEVNRGRGLSWAYLWVCGGLPQHRSGCVSDLETGSCLQWSLDSRC